MSTKSKHLIGIEYFKIKGSELNKMYRECKSYEITFSRLPKYTINDNNSIVEAQYYHQFTILDDSNDNEYIFIDIILQDKRINEEINCVGVDDFFHSFDFDKILNVFNPIIVDHWVDYQFPKINYIVVELTYNSSYDNFSGGFEYDMDYDIIGYLNNNFDFKKYDNNISVDK